MQMVALKLKVILLCIACQRFQIYLPIFIIEEYRGAVVTALGDVVRITGCYDAGHGVILAQGEGEDNGNMGSVPCFLLPGRTCTKQQRPLALPISCQYDDPACRLSRNGPGRDERWRRKG